MNIHKAVDEAFEAKSLKKVADASVDALKGATAADAERPIRHASSRLFVISALAAKEE